MTWNSNLLPEQEVAASHFGSHARLLAGPGTGKTLVLTRRILYLLEERNIDPDEIFVITFTRAAAFELRQRISDQLNDDLQPRISTLHSFSLRQLLRNARKLSLLPQPLRIADDWEERNIVLENIKSLMSLEKIDDARELFNQLSSDWESLLIDERPSYPNPRFVGTWEEHRSIFGYILRSEMVYQLKRSLEQIGDFELESPIRYLFVDEYQDLNKCDLAVVKAIADRGAELYVAGDDDQSIYGFRKAHPEGIRQFPAQFSGSIDLPLKICKRCDAQILEFAEFVAELDTGRISKLISPELGRNRGEVKILRFENEYNEAQNIALLCKRLIETESIEPEEILILLRSDTQGAYSKVLESAFNNLNIPISTNIEASNIFLQDHGRKAIAALRLCEDNQDSLSWYTLLKLRNNNIGKKCLEFLYEIARDRSITYSQAIQYVIENPSVNTIFGTRITSDVGYILDITSSCNLSIESEPDNPSHLFLSIGELLRNIGLDDGQANEVLSKLSILYQSSNCQNFSDLLSSLQSTNEKIEQELEENKVNVLTMHKAKGLSAKAVIILGAEDEIIPGRYEAEPSIGDERRLLYVSLTRAKHFLFVSYCDKRIGQQRMFGRNPGRRRRSLTRFLRNGPIHPQPGSTFINSR